jgi:hypothetical protein
MMNLVQLSEEYNSANEASEVPTHDVADIVKPLIRFSGAIFDGPAGKVISLDGAGGIKKDRQDRRGGVAFCKGMTWDEYVIERQAAKPNILYNSGNYADPEKFSGMPVVSKSKADGVTSVSMSNDYLAHVPGIPAICRIDVDYKDPKKEHAVYPTNLALPDIPERLELDLLDVTPELEGFAYMIMDSSSGMLSMDTGETLTEACGYRIEIPIAAGSKIPAFMDAFHEKCWAHGFGWMWVGKAGDIFERSLVDLPLKSPHQPDYAASELKDGIVQKRRVLVRYGALFDPDSLTPLTQDEKAEADRAKAEARAVLEPVAEKVKAEVRRREVNELVNNGVDKKRAEKMVGDLQVAGVLSGEMLVVFDNETVSVTDLILDGEGRDYAQCFDPLERDYAGDNPVAIFYWNKGLRPGVFTQAHGGKFYYLRFDKAGLKKLIEDGLDAVEIARCVALSKLSEVDEAQITITATKALGLGNRTKVISNMVRDLKAHSFQADRNNPDVAVDLVDGHWPLDKALPSENFPFNNDGSLIGHEANYAFLLEAYGIKFGYDMIAKKLIWTSYGLDTKTDNAEGALFSRIKSLAALNKLPNGNDALHTFLAAIAEVKQVNLVRDHLKSLKWDKKNRFEVLAGSLGSHDFDIALISIGRWLIQACAAADGAEMAQKRNPNIKAVFEYVLVLFGEQGIGKTKGLTNLMPRALGEYLKESVVLNINDKDSIKQAVSSWIAELGELDATFKVADGVAFKAFMSREHDELRMPFAAKTSKFRRRAVFVGSVNEPKFLKDKTGARRFFPLSVSRGFPIWSDAEVGQLWAQAWALYASGSQWWPTDAEQKLLDANAEIFRHKSWAEDRLEELYDWPLGPDGSRRTTATNIWRGINVHGGSSKPTGKEQNELSHGLKRLWCENGAYETFGDLVINIDGVVLKVYARDGKNRGWLLPPNLRCRVQ